MDRESQHDRGNTEPAGMDFQMPVIYFMFKLTVRVASKLRSWVNTIFHKLVESVNSSDI